MSQQGPVIVVANGERPPFATALEAAQIFPIIDTTWVDAARAVEAMQPAAVVVAASSDTISSRFGALANEIAARKPYLPLIAVDPSGMLPENAIPFASHGGQLDRLPARLRAALRVRTLHSTVMRRLNDDPAQRIPHPDTNPGRDATVLLIGRGAAYPSLSVSFGERIGVVGALSIE